MANNALQNQFSGMQTELSPWTWRASTPMKVGQQIFDPFNMTHWNDDPTPHFDYDTTPIPGYIPSYDPNSMAMEPYVSGLLSNDTGFKKFSKEALRNGPSNWANLANQQQYMEQAKATEGARNAVDSQMASGRSSLAMHGGLNSGARERLQQSGTRDYLGASQAIAKQGALNRLQVGMTDEANRQNMLSQLPGMELSRDTARANARSSDVGRQMQESQQRNQFNMNAFQIDQQRRNAVDQANATMNQPVSHGFLGLSWLCTVAGEVLSPEDWTMLKKLKRFGYTHDGELTKFYINDCDKLLKKMKEGGYDWKENILFVKKVVDLIERTGLESAFVFYKNHVKKLIKEYWPSCESLGLFERGN